MALLRLLPAAAACVLLLAAPVSAADKFDSLFRQLVVKRKFEQSARLAQRAAQEGHATAQYRLGMLYRIGLGVGRDDEKARAWVRCATKSGSKPAARLLSRLPSNEAVQTRLKHPPHIANAPLFAPRVAAMARDGAGSSWIARAAARGDLRSLLPLLRTNIAIGTEDVSTLPLLAASAMGESKAAAALLDTGDAVNATDKSGTTALMLAAESGDIETVHLLLARGADTRRADLQGSTALYFALRRCRTDVAKLLLASISGPSTSRAADGSSLLHVAVRYCPDSGIISSLAAEQDMNARDHSGRQPLWYAVARGDKRLVSLLLDLGSEPDGAGADGDSALHVASAKGEAAIISVLLEGGAKVDVLDVNGNTPLILAASKGCEGCIEAMMKANPEVGKSNVFGDTALHFAVRAGDVAIARRLVAAGADSKLRNSRRETPASIAETGGNEALLEILR